MPFVPFKKQSASHGAGTSEEAPSFSKKFAPKRRSSKKVAPAQKQLMNPGGRSMGGGGR
jgi:hypothetical protein